MYFASATRSDISFAMCKLSRYMSNSGDDHWRALERVMRYLKGTMSYGIRYTGHPKVLEGYCDANWMLMRFIPQVNMCFHLEVALFLGSLASRPS
jgi:hypothetical protein